MSLASHDVATMPQLLAKMDEYFTEDDKRIDYKEFCDFTRDFLPGATDEQLQQMFENVGPDENRTITKKELMESTFFTEFLRTSDAMFSIREQELVNRQHVETINQLQEYIRTTGRPAEFEVERLKIENADLKDEKRYLEKSLETLKNEFTNLQAQNKHHVEEIKRLESEREDQTDALHVLQIREREHVESSTQMELVYKDLKTAQERAQKDKEMMRELEDETRNLKSVIMRLEMEKSKLELELERTGNRSNRLEDELRQYQEEWKVERIRADTLSETVISLQNNIAEQETFIEQQAVYENVPQTMRISQEGFTVDNITSQPSEKDLHSQLQKQNSVFASKVDIFEGTPEPTQKVNFQSVLDKAKKCASRSNVNLPQLLTTPRGKSSHRRMPTGESTLSLDLSFFPPESERANSVRLSVDNDFLDVVREEMQKVNETIVDCVRSEAKSDKSEEVLAALARLQDEVAALKQMVPNGSSSQNGRQPEWAEELGHEVGDLNEKMTTVLGEVRTIKRDAGPAPATPSPGPPNRTCWGWWWEDRKVGTEYQSLNR